MSTYQLDAKRLLCPMPVIRTQNRIEELAPGDTLEVPDTPWEEPTIVASRQDEEGNISNMSVNLVPFGPQEHAAMSPRGYFIHTITTDYSLTLLRHDAPPLRIQKDYSPVPVTSGEPTLRIGKITVGGTRA